MEERIFEQLYTLIRELGKTHSFKSKRFSDAAIVRTFLWAVLWDRPICWACQLENWPAYQRWHVLPTPSTMSRRLRSIGVLSLLEQVLVAVREWFPTGLCKWIDSKPLEVSLYSKDPDARLGHGRGLPAKGYKIHAMVDARSRFPERWVLASMNRHDVGIAPDLIATMAPQQSAYLLGDNAYDSNALYEQVAAKQCQLLAPARPSARALGKCRHSPYRLDARQRLANPLSVTGQKQSFAQQLLQSRIGIEQSFACLGNIPGGLSPLPNWVRRPRRVALWVAAKILIVAAYRFIHK